MTDPIGTGPLRHTLGRWGFMVTVAGSHSELDLRLGPDARQLV